MSRRWPSPGVLFPFLLSAITASCQSFENTAIVRSVELGGSLVHVTTTYAAKALEPNVNTYTIALGNSEIEKTSWLDVKIKGQEETLEKEFEDGIEETVWQDVSKSSSSSLSW